MSKYLKYLKLFNEHDEYVDFTETDDFLFPNVSHCIEEQDVHYNPMPNNVIMYKAYGKLAETTNVNARGLHTNAFNTTMVSHTFKNHIGKIVFADDVTVIKESAFCLCEEMLAIRLPETIRNINKQAFKECTELVSMNIPNSVRTFGESSFEYCRNLKYANIPTSLGTIPRYCFRGCRSLTYLYIPNNVTQIGHGAFTGCSGITQLYISEGITDTNLGDQAFSYCSSLQNVTLPSGITWISNYLFEGCDLRSIVIPAGVTSISYGSFKDNVNLDTIISLPTSTPTIQNTTFQNIKENGTLYVPTGSSYSTWMSENNYYLGLYNWTKVEQ